MGLRIRKRNFLILFFGIPAVMALGLYIRPFTLSEEEKFLDAVEAGDYAETQKFIESGVDVNAQLMNTKPALAIAEGVAITKLLLEHGADPNLATSDDQTPLMFASGEEAQILLDYGANIDAKDDNDWTALMWASLTGSTETVKILIENGATVNTDKEYGTSALILAAQASRDALAISKILVEAGARTGQRDIMGRSALDYARESRNTELVQYLEAAMRKEKNSKF